MKYLSGLLFFLIFLLNNFKAACQQQDKLDLPGDNLNLYAVLKLFQDSPTLESFEKSLNDESNKINNLDLDGDGKTDYIQVDDSIAGPVHNIVLRIAVNNNEAQNVAVIAVEKNNNGKVQMQLIGDEDLYGKDYIVEPDYDGISGQTPNPGYTGDQQVQNDIPQNQNVVYVPVETWPVIQYIYVPSYNPWRSPFYWNHYPNYWRPWHPFYWHVYYGYQYHWNYYYTAHYRRWNSYRIPGWREQYYGGGYRVRAPIVQTRYQQGYYRQTYSRPQLASQGSAMFRKDHPKAPSVNTKLPPFDRNGRPMISRPAITNPGTRPVTNPGTRPVTRPGSGTRPIANPDVRPGPRPVITNPGTRPGPKPVVTNPDTRPVTKPITRPVTRPAITQPESRPVTRPAPGPINNSSPRPTTQPSVRPVPRQAPVNNNRNINPRAREQRPAVRQQQNTN